MSDVRFKHYTFAEAREIAQRIKDDPLGERRLRKEFKRRRGWVALRYKSWRECEFAEFRNGLALPTATVYGKALVAKDGNFFVACHDRGAIKKVRRSPMEWVQTAEHLAHEHGGVLPRTSWLNKNGFSGLNRAMRNHPDLFSHIQQDAPRKPYKTLEEWVSVAEQLAKEHGGILPCCNWLAANGCAGLRFAMHYNPERFDHIPREIKGSRGLVVSIRLRGKDIPIDEYRQLG